jgi:hypothetical protein
MEVSSGISLRSSGTKAIMRRLSRLLLAAITLALGTAGRTMEFDADAGSFVVGGVPFSGTLRFTGGNNRCAQASSDVDENFVDISFCSTVDGIV